MAEGQFKVRLADGREFGPAEMNTVAQWAREGRVPADSLLVPADNPAFPRSVLTEPLLKKVIQAPPTVFTGVPQPTDGGAMSGMIPYKNPPALVGYYLAVFSLLPVIGICLGLPAVILGIVGLRKRSKDPKARGMAHALIAIILGALTSTVYGIMIVAMIARASR